MSNIDDKIKEKQLNIQYKRDILKETWEGGVILIKRETYMRRIRPFIGNELIKVMTGIRRAGKSVMLELIQEELICSGVTPEHFY